MDKLTQIRLKNNEVWPLLNVINEVCHGIRVSDFEKSIGAKKQKVVDFMDNLSSEVEKSEVVLVVNNLEMNFINNSFEEVLKQIDEWEFQTRIGVSTKEAKKIKDKFHP